MAMAAEDGNAGLQVDAKRRAEEHLLGVVDSQGVARQQSIDEAAADAIEGKLGPVSVRFIGKGAMARNKLASGRPKDLVDAALLQSDE